MPIQLIHNGIEGLGEDRVPSIQLPTHAQPLRTLTRKHHDRLAGRHGTAADHRGIRSPISHPNQPSQQLVTAITHHHRPMVKHRPSRHQRIPHINGIQLRPSPHIPLQPTRLSSQRRRRLTRNHPRHHTTISTPTHQTHTTTILFTRNRIPPNQIHLLNNHMRISPAHTKRRHPSPPRPTRHRRPLTKFAGHFQAQLVERNIWMWFSKPPARNHEATLDHQHRFN